MKEDSFVLMFCKSLNAYNQYMQSDCLVRLWDDGKEISHYYSSDFTGQQQQILYLIK